MTTTALTAERILASEGYDKNGFPIDAPKDTDATVYDLERFLSGRQSALALDDGERADAVDADDDVAHIAEREAVRAATFRANGQHERADEAERHAEHLTALYKLTERNRARETLRVRDLASNREFTDAVLMGDLHKANAMLIAVVRDKKAPHALRIACVGAMKQIAALVGTDDGGELTDAWLSRITGIARSSCKELVDAHRRVGTDLALLLLGTEDETPQGIRKWGKMEGEYLSSAVDNLKQFHTAQMIAHAGDCEEVARVRKIGLSEANILDAVGMNNSAGREQLVRMPVKAGQLWLATMLDETHEAAERTGGIVSTAQGAADSTKGRLVKPLSPAVPTRRLLTQRQLNAENVREL